MFILDTDASNIGIGAVLSQVQDKEEKVIEYFSSVLSKPEKNFCVTRKELLAFVRAVEHFHKYLYAHEFLIRTDHAALTWLLRMKNPERVQHYHFKIRHRAGQLHNNADCLSRRQCKNCKHCDKIEQRETSFNCGSTAVVEDEEWTTAQLRKDQEEDIDIGPLVKWKENEAERSTWSEIAVDIAGPFPVTEDGNQYIMVGSDYFNKWPEAYAIPNQEATTVVKMLIDN